MSEPTKEAGDVISTLSLMHHFQYHACHLDDVVQILHEAEAENGSGFLMEMADGSQVSVMVSVYEGV